MNVNAEIQGRPKHFYSIYSKIKKGRDFSTIYDLTAIRIIVDSVKDCYAALGAVHALWTPLPGRFKDYIAMPKPNMYQSLHTTVVGPAGEPLEIQIRTWEMHRTGEYGIAAHWRYKEGGKADQFENKLSWLRALLEWQKDMRDSRVFMENLKLDLFDSQVFVFSPRGDVYSMPAGGTPLDFAYSVHTDVGNHCVGAKVNGRIVPLDYQMQNGDICEILVNKSSARPSLDWLSVVKTSSAKHKIKQWFRKERREENVLAGQEALEQELARAGLRTDTARGELIERIAGRLNYGRPPICLRRSDSATHRRKPSRSACATSSRATTSSILPRSAQGPRRARPPAKHRACASPASTTCWCVSRNAVRRSPAIRSSAT